jgi:hypothetical protein
VSFLNAFNRHIFNRPADLGANDSDHLNGSGQVVPGNFGRVQYLNFTTGGGGGYLLFPRKIQLQLKFEF